jgi:polysaccharide biosynthesis/export protein
MARSLKVVRMASEAEGVSPGYLVLFFCLALLCQVETAGLAAEEAPVADRYPLGPGDLLEVRVMGDESVSRAFSGQFLVEADGTVNYPVVGNLPIEGATLSQVAHLIKETVEVIAPISGMPFVRVAEYAPVYVVGDVARTGSYAFRPATTVLQLVLRAGGLAESTDMSRRIKELTNDIAELEVVGYALLVQRSRLLAELGNEEFDGEASSLRPVVNDDLLENEAELFEARRREMLSQVRSYEAQERTYAQEIASLGRTITLHDQELELLKERFAGQQSLAEQGLAPKSQLLDARREILGMERQGLEFRTALVRANQGKLAIARQLDDVKIGTEVRNRQTLSQTERDLARNRLQLAGARLDLRDLEQPEGPGSMLGPAATYTILRQKGNQIETTRADELSFLHRGDILRVDRGSDELQPVHDALAAGSPAALH